MLTMTSRRVGVLGALGIVATVASAGTFPAFPRAGDSLAGSTVITVADGSPIEAAFDVLCHGVNIGQVRTQYGLMQLRDSQGHDHFGPYIRFGFDRNTNDPCPPGSREPPGVQYRWIQTVRTNYPINGAPNDQWFVDYAPGQTGNPFYSQQDQGRWGFTTATDDRPSRPQPISGNAHWFATTSLVCTHDSEINVLFTFNWGFFIHPVGTSPAAEGTSPFNGMIGGRVPSSVLDTIRADANSQGYTIGEGCCCEAVPMPTASLLCGAGLAACVAVSRRRLVG